jgi:putative CocE/NonD family hydrolase
MGPWSHSVPTGAAVGVEDFGLESSQHVSPLGYDVEAEYLAFFRRWLLDADEPEWPAPIKLFTMGRNSWRYEPEWPPPATETHVYFLHSDGRANSRAGDGSLSLSEPHDEPHDRFEFSPDKPVPTTGGDLCCYPSKLTPGPFDQAALEDREDILVYATEPMPAPLEVTGNVRLELWASTSAPDTDFTAKLVRVQTCGRALNLTDGILRASFRLGPEGGASVTPNEPQQYTIDLGSTSVVLDEGERIGLEISSSNYPRFDLNRAAANATQHVFHDGTRPSRLMLPVVQ